MATVEFPDDDALTVAAMLSPPNHDYTTPDIDNLVKEFVKNKSNPTLLEKLKSLVEEHSKHHMPLDEIIFFTKDSKDFLNGPNTSFRSVLLADTQATTHHLELITPYGFAVLRIPPKIFEKYENHEAFDKHIKKNWMKHYHAQKTEHKSAGLRTFYHEKHNHIKTIVGGGAEMQLKNVKKPDSSMSDEDDIPKLLLSDVGMYQPLKDHHHFWPATLGKDGFIGIVKMESMHQYHDSSSYTFSDAKGTHHVDYYIVVKASPYKIVQQVKGKLEMEMNEASAAGYPMSIQHVISELKVIKEYVFLNVGRLIIQMFQTCQLTPPLNMYKMVSMKHPSGHVDKVLTLNTDALTEEDFEYMLINMPLEMHTDMHSEGKIAYEFQKNVQSIQSKSDVELGIGSRYILNPQSNFESFDENVFYRLQKSEKEINVMLPTVSTKEKVFMDTLVDVIPKEELNLADKSTLVALKSFC